MLVYDKLLVFVSHHWVLNQTVMVWLQKHKRNRAFSSDDEFMIKFGEVFRSRFQSGNVCVPILHVDVVIGWYSDDIVCHLS